MKHTKKEILDALKVIKDVCAEMKNCSECPFGMTYAVNGCNCKLDRKVPSDWDIVEEGTEVWRAFK